jgi:hypothetical protein
VKALARETACAGTAPPAPTCHETAFPGRVISLASTEDIAKAMIADPVGEPIHARFPSLLGTLSLGATLSRAGWPRAPRLARARSPQFDFVSMHTPVRNATSSRSIPKPRRQAVRERHSRSSGRQREQANEEPAAHDGHGRQIGERAQQREHGVSASIQCAAAFRDEHVEREAKLEGSRLARPRE